MTKSPTMSTNTISLSRLLARLESSIGDDEKLNALNEVELRKAAANIDSARKLVIQLERSQGPGTPSAAAIAEQRKRIMYLHSQVSLAQQRLADIVAAEDKEEVNEDDDIARQTNDPATNVNSEPTSVLRDRLFGNEKKATDTSTEHVLQHHRMLQDELSEAMVDMARGLKQRSIAFGEALRQDSKLIENTTNMLSTNVDRMGTTGGRLQAYSKTSRGMTWLILGAIVVVFLAWLFMYFIIRFIPRIG